MTFRSARALRSKPALAIALLLSSAALAADPGAEVDLSAVSSTVAQSAKVEARSAKVDVTRFGAVADGVTDCAPAIQAAIDDVARAGGGRVVLPPAAAAYLVRDTIRISSSDIEIAGAGARIQLADGAIDGRRAEVLLVAGTERARVQRVAIRGLTIDANYFNQDGARGSKAVVFRFAEASRIEDVTITRGYVGLSIRRSAGVEARRVIVTDYDEDAFDAGGDADLVSGGIATAVSFVDVTAHDAPRAAADGNAFEIEDGVDGILIQDALVENVAGNGVGMRNHDTADHVNRSRNVELRGVTFRNVGGAFAVFASARPLVERAVNSYRGVRLVNVTADAPVAFWGPLEGIELEGGRYGAIYVGFDAAAALASAAHAVRDATLANLEAHAIRINGASSTVRLTDVRAGAVEHIGAR